jgi:RND family efflux transporter MFP subunit
MNRLLPFALLLLVAGCSRSDPAIKVVAGPPLAVHTAAVAVTTSMRHQPVAGTVRAREHATVAARVMGLVTTTDLAVGRTVAAGEVLVTLQAGEIEARLAQARALLNQAERDYEREQSLETQGATTAEAVRSAADRRQQARAAVEEATAMLTYTRIAAPFNGVITADHVKAGDLAVPGQPLFTLEGIDRWQAEVMVPESLAALPLGANLAVQLNDDTVNGQLVEFSPAADASSRTRLARINLPTTAEVRSGQFVRALWPADEVVSVTVPTVAVSQLGQMERVFVVAGNQAQLRLVKTGGTEAARTVILAGLSAGETVILNPPANLRDGQSVTIVP